MSYWYTSRELPIRLSFFWSALSLTVILNALMAYGLLHMDGISGLAGWRWLFLIEGLLTLVIGAGSFFCMPASAVQTKSWWCPQGWFTDREISIIVNRVLRDDPGKGDMHNRKAITPRRLWKALSDYDLWPVSTLLILQASHMTKAFIAIPYRAFRLRPPIPTQHLPHPHPQKYRFRHLHHEHPHYSLHGHWDTHPAWHNLAIRTRQRAQPDLQLSGLVDASLPHRAAYLARRPDAWHRLGHLWSYYDSVILPLCARYCGGVDKQKFRQRAHEDDQCCGVQLRGAGRQCV